MSFDLAQLATVLDAIVKAVEASAKAGTSGSALYLAADARTALTKATQPQSDDVGGAV